MASAPWPLHWSFQGSNLGGTGPGRRLKTVRVRKRSWPIGPSVNYQPPTATSCHQFRWAADDSGHQRRPSNGMPVQEDLCSWARAQTLPAYGEQTRNPTRSDPWAQVASRLQQHAVSKQWGLFICTVSSHQLASNFKGPCAQSGTEYVTVYVPSCHPGQVQVHMHA